MANPKRPCWLLPRRSVSILAHPDGISGSREPHRSPTVNMPMQWSLFAARKPIATPRCACLQRTRTSGQRVRSQGASRAVPRNEPPLARQLVDRGPALQESRRCRILDTRFPARRIAGIRGGIQELCVRFGFIAGLRFPEVPRKAPTNAVPLVPDKICKGLVLPVAICSCSTLDPRPSTPDIRQPAVPG
jgi:hypothetical protein